MFKLDRNTDQLGSAALVLAILLPVALLPPGATPVAAESPAVATPSDQPEFHQDRFTEDRGDVATVDANDRSNATLRVLTANGTQPANLSSQAAIEAAIENGTFDDDGRFSAHDAILIELETSKISEALENQPGQNTTAKFLNLLDEPGFSLTIREWYASIDTEEEAAEFTPTPDATTVVADPANDSTYVLLNVARLTPHERGEPDESTRIEDRDVFDVEVTYPSAGNETGQSLTSRVRFVSSVTAETPVTVDPAENQTIEMDSDLTSTRNVRVMLRSDDGIVRVARTVEVEADGTLVATFDLSTVPPGKTLTLTVDRLGWGTLYSAHEGVHVRAPSTPNTTSTPTQTPTASPTQTATPPTERSPTGTPGPAPGLGMGAALVALAVALMAAGRRR